MDRAEFSSWLVYKRGLKQSSIETVHRRLAYFTSFCGQNTLNHKICENFILFLRKNGRRNQTINGYILLFTYLSEFLGQRLTKNINFLPKQTKVPTVLSVDEIEAIIDSPCATESSYQFPDRRRVFLNKMTRMAVWFLASTGCRFGEMASTVKEDLSLGIECGHVTFKDTKTGIDRRVPLPPLLVEELKEYTSELKPNQLVFTSSSKNPLVEQTFNPWLRKKVENARVNKHVYAHCFRNSYIMEHLRRSTDVLTIAKLVGHASVDTTMGYTKFTYEDIERGAENHPLFAKTITPQKVIEKLVDVVDQWPVTNDRRFSFRKEVRENSLLFEIYVK